jgi:hypothetical protein
MNLDELSPATIGEDKIGLTQDVSTIAQVGKVLQIDVDYSAVDLIGGVSLPIDVIVQGPTEAGFLARVYRNYKPVSISFVPVEAGDHLVLIREQAHNRWVGRLIVTVAGDPFQQV